MYRNFQIFVILRFHNENEFHFLHFNIHTIIFKSKIFSIRNCWRKNVSSIYLYIFIVIYPGIHKNKWDICLTCVKPDICSSEDDEDACCENDSDPKLTERSFTTDPDKRWPNSTVPYIISNFSDHYASKIRQYLRDIEAISCVT